MTLVVTTASKLGITVVVDGAASTYDKGKDTVSIPSLLAQKLFYSQAGNISLACWGKTSFPGRDYVDFLDEFTQNRIDSSASLDDVANLLAKELTKELSIFVSHDSFWGDLRRGIHVAGYIDDLPCIYHVHMGTKDDGYHEPRVHKDFPNVHFGSIEEYRKHLDKGRQVHLRNGFHELSNVVAGTVTNMFLRLEEVFDMPLPAPSLRGQLGIDKVIVNVASGLLEAFDVAQQVSEVRKCLMFTREGEVKTDANHRDMERLRLPDGVQAFPTYSLDLSG